MRHTRAVTMTGYELICNARLNKGLAFSETERATFELSGLLPPAIQTIKEQIASAKKTLSLLPTPLAKHIWSRTLQDSNETLFYALLEDDLATMLPLIYTPTVGEACENFSHIWTHSRGVFLSYPERAAMEKILANPAYDDVKVIVVTDGERILGLGDQGAGGMGIPIGKLSLYTACAGIAPEHTLPIMLDTGTNNHDRRQDPAYIGWRNDRVRGAEYDAFIEQFVCAVKKRWPKILLQWEDFANQNAAPILKRYRERLCTFNDDIQGTAVVAAGTLLAATHAAKGRLKEQTIVLVGAGSAGIGIANLLVQIMIEEGVSEAEAHARFYLLDKDGLLVSERKNLDEGQVAFVRKDWKKKDLSLKTVIEESKPTILIGVSGAKGAFSEDIIRSMVAHCPKPIIFPLSNPTSHVEATPSDILNWTDGRALVSTGSPFAPVEFKGSTRPIDQVNNAYIFPGLGLGVLASEARHISNGMLSAAARALADLSPRKKDPSASLLPPLSELRGVAHEVATAIAQRAQEDGLCPSFSSEALRARIDALTWSPIYQEYERA